MSMDPPLEGLAEAGSPESGFLIDGERYEVPLVETITLDEERILHLFAGVILEDFAPAHPNATDEERATHVREQVRKIGSPDFKKAWVIIAYLRKHPDAEMEEASKAAGRSNALQVTLSLLGDDASPPAMSSQKQPERSSGSNGHSTPSPSGSATERSSGQVVDLPVSTGTGG